MNDTSPLDKTVRAALASGVAVLSENMAAVIHAPTWDALQMFSELIIAEEIVRMEEEIRALTKEGGELAALCNYHERVEKALLKERDDAVNKLHELQQAFYEPNAKLMAERDELKLQLLKLKEKPGQYAEGESEGWWVLDWRGEPE